MASTFPIGSPVMPASDLLPTAVEEAQIRARAEGVALSPPALLRAVAQACRGPLEARWAQTQAEDVQRLAGLQGAGRAEAGVATARRVHYLSMEFLMGRALHNALSALGLQAGLEAALQAQGASLADVLEAEGDAALGNGGLGRLAACFLDSFAELGLPSFGYGMRYRYGMFAQRIVDGRQSEIPDDWMRDGNPWEILRPEVRYPVHFGGRVIQEGVKRRWVPAETVLAQAYDFIVPAHHSARTSTLRQWQAVSEQAIDFERFCQGEYEAAGRAQHEADLLNWVLYPDDSTQQGRRLRLKQEAFLVSASLQDVVARHLREVGSLEGLSLRNAVHLNDTHPALAPAELMRLLLDEQGLPWAQAWTITSQAISYTNHTLMPEALETWPVWMFEELLPRHLEIIYEINHHFLEGVRAQFPDDGGLAQALSIVAEHGERRLRMANLSIIASHRVNGVSALHSDLMVQTIFKDFARLWPQRFHNVTNGVTPRRWLQQANPALSAVLDGALGPRWRQDLMALEGLHAKAEDAALQRAFSQAKLANKQRLAERIRRELGLQVDPQSLFDVQVKRIHEYKRQLLNVLQVVARYQAILAHPQGLQGRPWVPRTVIMAGKAASAYRTAKLIIQLAHDVARTINADPRVQGLLKFVFLPNYSVSLAEVIIPAADLSEQISTAGTEASGTGNMKFSLNGALTIGTWDGANIEMAQAMGVDEMFVFGLRTEQVDALKQAGYEPRRYAEQDPALAQVLHAIAAGDYSPGERGRYAGLVQELLNHDPYLLLADFSSYCAVQAQVDALYAQPAAWQRRAIRTVAGMGVFSSDRTIAEYVQRVWSVTTL
ncbi:MAG: glycogen/starch/alpha-glucan phosphorylase [Betaproteobacteria bacterium]